MRFTISLTNLPHTLILNVISPSCSLFTYVDEIQTVTTLAETNEDTSEKKINTLSTFPSSTQSLQQSMHR